MKIQNCYDSHLHWYYSGEVPSRLDLSHLVEPEKDLKKISIHPEHFRGEWLIGFGWNHHNWIENELPTREILDRVFPGFPVAFSRGDGHAIWVNTLALKKAGLLPEYSNTPTNRGDNVEYRTERDLSKIDGGQIVRDDLGRPTGVFIDNASSLIDPLVPSTTNEQVYTCLEKAMVSFHKKGITHIRDLSCSTEQWNEEVRLFQRGHLQLAVEQFISVADHPGFDQALALAVRARNEKIPLIRVPGIKVYYDGALGSGGALISGHYGNCPGHQGFQVTSDENLKDYMIRTWEKKFDISVHVIGDEAVHQVMSIASSLWDQGHMGRLHLEHVELIHKKTFSLMKGRNLYCHLQPSHWLSDKKWLNDRVQLSDQVQVFPWAQLEKNDIPIFFGSDSPIESADPRISEMAIKDASNSNIEPPGLDWWKYHEHPDPNWVLNTFSQFNKEGVISVFFNGQIVNVVENTN